MNSGSFFRLDLDTSKVAEGITFFNYLDAPDFRDGVDCLRYPIRVAISSENVSFFIHYFDDYKAGLTNDVERKEELLRPHHAEETILLLPYGSTDPEELSSSIKRIYNTTFPIGSSYLKELIEDRYIKKYDEDDTKLGKCERGYKRLQNSKVNKDSYSSLYIWGLLSSDDRIIVTSDSNRTISKFLRKLLLDFMFDLMHSDVFESSKYYAQMREGLMSDFFFSSIIKKSEYYYYRRLVRNRFKSVVDSINDQKFLKDCSLKLHRLERKSARQVFWHRFFHSSEEQINNNYQDRLKKIKEDKRLGPAYETIQKLREQARKEEKNENDVVRAAIKSKNEFDDLLKCVNFLRKQERRKKRKEWLARQVAPYFHVSATDSRNDDTDIESKHDSFENKHDSSFALIKSIKGLYAEKLDEAESEWTNVIMGSLSDKHFSFSPEWYEDQDSRQKKAEFSVSESWFVNPEEEMTRVCFPLSDAREQSRLASIVSILKGLFSKKIKITRSIHYLNSLELSELIGTKENSSVADRNTKISKWFYRRFDFDDTFRLYSFKYWNQFFAGILLAFGISAIVPSFWMCPKNLALFPFAISACFLLSSFYLLFICSRFRRKESIDDILVCRRRKREALKSVRYSLLCAAIWAILFFYDEFDAWPLPLIKVLTLLGVSFILLRWIKPRVHILNNIHLFLPRLVASITAAWIIIVIGNDLVKEHLSWPICVVLSFIVFFFILYESYKSLPNILTRPRIWRALELMLISFSISLIIGVFAIDILSPSLLSDIKDALSQSEPYNINIPEYRIADSTKPTIWPFVSGVVNWSLTLFPPYLIQFSFLAMFIGVFIQMIFEEKNITEM